MPDEQLRRWVRYDASGAPRKWWQQPLFLGLVFLALSVVANAVAAVYWMTQGEGWFGSAAGQQLPVVAVLFVLLAAVGLSRRPG